MYAHVKHNSNRQIHFKKITYNLFISLRWFVSLCTVSWKKTSISSSQTDIFKASVGMSDLLDIQLVSLSGFIVCVLV